MKATDVVNKIREVLGVELSAEIKLAQETLENGTIIEAESLEAGNEVFIVNEDERIALPVGEYQMADGKVLVVAEEGIIAEIKENAEETPEETEAKEDEVEVEAKEEISAPKKVVESVTKETHFSAEQTEIIETKLSELKAELKAEILAELKAENKVKKEELSKVELEAEPFHHNPEKVEKNAPVYNKSFAPTLQNRIFQKLNA